MSAKQVVQKCIILSIFLCSLTVSVFAEGVKGRVLDANSGEPLVGATVTLNKQSTYVKLDGTYQFKSTNAGKSVITVTYTGYITESKEIQIVNTNETKIIDINLRSTSVNLSSVTVSSSNKENDNAIRRLEKVADPIINVLSAKNIQLLPDITVANALQRISGVTIEKSGSGEARYPIIRGMEKRYINTLVNGIKIPSPDNKNRFIPLDLFPSELLERLEVGKSLTPSLEGDAI
jgi:hypothetical protein